MRRGPQTAPAWRLECGRLTGRLLDTAIAYAEGYTADPRRFRLHPKDAKEIARAIRAFRVILRKSIDQARVVDLAPRVGMRLVVDNTKSVQS